MLFVAFVGCLSVADDDVAWVKSAIEQNTRDQCTFGRIEITAAGERVWPVGHNRIPILILGKGKTTEQHEPAVLELRADQPRETVRNQNGARTQEGGRLKNVEPDKIMIT